MRLPPTWFTFVRLLTVGIVLSWTASRVPATWSAHAQVEGAQVLDGQDSSFVPNGALFPNPGGLVDFIAKQVGTVKLRPDHKIVFIRPWDTPSSRVKGLHTVLTEMARLATAA